MNEKTKNILWAAFVVVFLLAFAYLIIFDDFEHIEDTNGANTTINRITDQQIIDNEMDSKGMKYGKSRLEALGLTSGMVNFSSDQFTGVIEIMQIDYMIAPTFTLDIYNYQINEGNFELVLISNDRIIARLSPGDEETFTANIKGDLRVVAVGESANFYFEMTRSYFDQFTHVLWE